MAGAAGMYLTFLRVPLIVKISSVGFFIGCFLSASPYTSFTSYISFVACLYFFCICWRFVDHQIVMRMLAPLIILNILLMAFQAWRSDSLLNFGGVMSSYGTVGQYMQMASFSVILSAALLSFSPVNLLFPVIATFFCNSAGALLSAIAGAGVFLFSYHKEIAAKIFVPLLAIFLIFAFSTGKIQSNISSKNGRLNTWSKTIELANERPWAGWGPCTYKYLFPAMCGIDSLSWKMAHNCWLQILFEYGRIGLAVFIGYFVYLFISLFRIMSRAIFRPQAVSCLAGLAMISINMMIHFPTRMIQTVLIILFFLAYCEGVISHARE